MRGLSGLQCLHAKRHGSSDCGTLSTNPLHLILDLMHPRLKAAFAHEMALAGQARRAHALDLAFAHLERAHILGQRFTWPHLRSHLGMLVIGWQRRDWREIAGQLARIPAALLLSKLWVPAGNTGGANVRATRSIPIPEDLQALLADASP